MPRCIPSGYATGFKGAFLLTQSYPDYLLPDYLSRKLPNLFQSAPKSSPLTFAIDGDASTNQLEVSQNAADDNSPLTCTPGSRPFN